MIVGDSVFDIHLLDEVSIDTAGWKLCTLNDFNLVKQTNSNADLVILMLKVRFKIAKKELTESDDLTTVWRRRDR